MNNTGESVKKNMKIIANVSKKTRGPGCRHQSPETEVLDQNWRYPYIGRKENCDTTSNGFSYFKF